MDVYISSEIGECINYLPDGKSKKETVSIVISPLRVEVGEDKLRVVSGCSMFSGCNDPGCHYSAAARRLPKIKARD